MGTVLLYIAAIAVCWGGYPLLVRSAMVTNYSSPLILSLTAIVPIMFLSLGQKISLPDGNAAIKLLISGIMMGLGTIMFNLVATNRQINLSNIIPIMNSSMIMVTCLGGIVFFSETITAQKIAGILLLMAGIFLLRPAG